MTLWAMDYQEELAYRRNDATLFTAISTDN
jgi:hypothetical protein